MVPGAGLEPARYCYRGILSPLRLPISPPGHRETLLPLWGKAVGLRRFTDWAVKLEAEPGVEPR